MDRINRIYRINSMLGYGVLDAALVEAVAYVPSQEQGEPELSLSNDATGKPA